MHKAIVLAAVFSLVAAPAFAGVSNAGLGGGVGFNRGSLVIDGTTVEYLNNFTPSLNLVVPQSGMTEDDPDGTFGIAILGAGVSDSDIDVLSLGVGPYFQWGNITFVTAVMNSWLDPGDAGGKDILASSTKTWGGYAAMQFVPLGGLPMELAGNWQWRWDGVEDVQLRNIRLSLQAARF